MRAASAVTLALALIACGPASQGEPGAKGDKGDPGVPGPPGEAATTLGQQVVEVVGSGQLQVSSATNFTVVPGLSASVTVPANARVLVSTSGGIQCSQAGAAYSVVDVALFVDDAISSAGGQRRIVAANTASLGQTIANWSFGRTYNLPPGNYRFEVRAAGVDAGAAIANVSSGTAAQLQGVLTVTVLRL